MAALGWVQLGGKYAGKPCAKQPGQTTKPKCGSSKMKRNLDKGEEEAAFRRKQKEDPNPDRKGKAINVHTEDKELNTIAKELDKASKMHASQAERVRKHVKKMKKDIHERGDFCIPILTRTVSWVVLCKPACSRRPCCCIQTQV